MASDAVIDSAPSADAADPHALTPLVVACLAATWFIWGSTYYAIKLTLADVPPFIGMGSRFIVAGVLLAGWMRWVRGAPWPNATAWRNAWVLGTLMLGGGMGATAYAEQSVGSGLVVAFIAVIPVMMALGNLVRGIVPSGREALGIGVGLLGVLMLTRGGGFQASPAGLVAVLVACVTWTIGSLLSQHRLPLAPGPMGFASEMLCGGVVLMLIGALHGDYSIVAGHGWPSPTAWAAWAYLVVFGSLIGFNAYMLLLARSSAGLASSYTFVNPVIAMLLGVLVGGEQVSPFEWAASGVVLGAVVLLLSGRRAR